MPTPRGKGLSGSADDRTPGWEQRAKDRLFASEAEKVRKHGSRARPGQIRLDVDIPFLHALRQAAEARGMSSTGYARRAIAAFISKDLGIPFPDLTKNFPAPYKSGEMLKPGNRSVYLKKGKTVDDGEGFGDWEVR